MYTVQSRKHRFNMIGQTNPTDHKKPVNRKKKRVISKVNKAVIMPNLETDKLEVQLIGANNAGELGFILRKFTYMKNAVRFLKKVNSVKK